MVGGEGDQRAVGRGPARRSRSTSRRDLGVHAADRAVVPVLRAPTKRLGVDAGLLRAPRASPCRAAPWSGSAMTFFRPPSAGARTRRGPCRVGAHRVVGPVRLVRVVRDRTRGGRRRTATSRCASSQAQEPVHVLARGLARAPSSPAVESASCSSSKPWCRFVSLPVKSTEENESVAYPACR